MRDAARLLLEREISRRAFVSRLVQAGVAASAADRLGASLIAADQSSAAPPAPSRILENLTGGELMAEFLVEWKVPYVFGIGGSEEIGFLDALVDRISLQYVQGLHEGSVMSMADGYARASGTTAFVNVHAVAGTAYALGPMANAFKDRVPVVITAGNQSTKVRGHQGFLEADNLQLVPRDVTRWTWDVLNAATIPEVLRRAFLFARVPPGGPTFISVSKDLWEQRVPRAEIHPPSRSRPEIALVPDTDVVRRAVDVLLSAELPVIVAGREIGRYGGAADLAAIAEEIGAPVYSDLYASHSAITFPTAHPQYGGYFAEDEHFAKGFDAFWSAGGTMFTIMADPPAPLVPRSVRVVHTSLDAMEIGRNYPVDVPMTANVSLAAVAMLEEMRRRSRPTTARDARRRRIAEIIAARRKQLDERAARAWDQQPISTERLSRELDRVLDPDAIVIAEVISEEQLACTHIHFNQSAAGRRMFPTSGGCLGWGLGAAVGAKIGQPDKQVVALVGDGSFHFGVQALWTAARYDVPIAVVIWNNGAYQANRRYLHEYGGRAAATGKYIGASLESPAIDHLAIARGYGVEGERVSDPKAVVDALGRCLRANRDGRPYVVDVKVARRFGGAESTWHDAFSIATKTPRQT
jgi:benzoylformate decarboxylase